VTLVSRAFHSDRLGPFCAALAQLCGKDMVLPMNSGAEAVESGIKVARKWGADVKGVPEGMANIVVAHNNFHGRTISIVSFSSDPVARDGFGPYTPGFRAVPFGDADAVAAAIASTDLATIVGKVAWNGAGVPPFAAKNVTKTPLVGGQWRIKDGGGFDLVIVDNSNAPEIPAAGKMEALG